jgi:hypothetical protein
MHLEPHETKDRGGYAGTIFNAKFGSLTRKFLSKHIFAE